MMRLDVALVRRKLSAIVRNVGDLQSVATLSLDEYRSDRFRQKGIERLLQETIEAAADANQHLLRAVGTASPTDYHDSFTQLGRSGIVPRTLAAKLAPAAGLRNRLVHEYDAIDDEIVLGAIKTACSQFSAYVNAVERYLEEMGGG